MGSCSCNPRKRKKAPPILFNKNNKIFAAIEVHRTHVLVVYIIFVFTVLFLFCWVFIFQHGKLSTNHARGSRAQKKTMPSFTPCLLDMVWLLVFYVRANCPRRNLREFHYFRVLSEGVDVRLYMPYIKPDNLSLCHPYIIHWYA